MRIYFAGSIRGGRNDAALYRQIIALLGQHGQVLTEHVADTGLTPAGEEGLSDEAIYERDMAWLTAADAVVAEVTMPSHGVGYEIARAETMGKPVLCIHRPSAERRLSAMLAGNPALQCETYATVEDLTPILERFLKTVPGT
jgi:nucleoside 2-deoxyribosyltransferase